MYNSKGLHEERFLVRNTLNRIKSFLTIRAFAEKGGDSTEPVGAEPTQTTTTQSLDNKGQDINVTALMTKIRQEEKDKLYSTISEKNTENSKLKLELEESQKQVAELKSTIKDLEEKLENATKDEGEVITSLRDGEKHLNKEIKRLEQENATLKATLEDKEEEFELKLKGIKEETDISTYRLQKIYEVGVENVIPEMVIGTTREEIDASLKQSQERVEIIRGTADTTAKPVEPEVPQGRAFNTPQAPKPRGGSNTQFTFEDLATLDPLSPEYAKAREQFFGSGNRNFL